MTRAVQADRPLTVTTPLRQDDLLLAGFSGAEAISRLFEFQLDLLAENATAVPFDMLLGGKISVHLTMINGRQRHFSGICKRVSEGTRGLDFTSYRMEVVPQLWLLTRRSDCRIFQQKTVPDILKEVLSGLDVLYEIEGTFHPRDYCVQYRESDFDFASRLMEEEGIYYFFRHAENGHTLVVANTPRSHPELPVPIAPIWLRDPREPRELLDVTDLPHDLPDPTQRATILYATSEEGLHGENRISSWEKAQELRSGKCTLWDHCFELPQKHLEAEKATGAGVAVGKVTHKLRVGQNDQLEIYDYPGGYAQRFDGVNPGGGDRPADLGHILEDNTRTVKIRMEEEEAAGVTIQGTGTCRQFVSGYRFTLERHFNADGPYVLTSVQHRARMVNAYRSDGDDAMIYENSFTCIPASVPFRPARTSPKPIVRGPQTAVVVGPGGEEIFTDKYGRVKVQFHWDRQGKNDANSSCWIRVGSQWAGKNWGAIHIPRIGQEVVVDFLEGDPDRPLITGSVYNADQMPPYPLPGSKVISGVKSRSYPGGGGYNEFILDDTKGNELIRVHGQYDMDSKIEHDLREHVLNDRSRDVTNDETIKIGNDRKTNVGNNETLKVGKVLLIDVGDEITIQTGMSSINMKKDGTITIKGKDISIEGTLSIDCKVGQSDLKFDPAQIQLTSMMVSAEAQVQMQIKGLMTQINALAMLQTQGGITMMS